VAAPARLELALAPTPLLKLDRLSRRLGVELYVKRDDLTGLVESGNKIRKLEFLVGDALQQGADTLIACGTRESACCLAVAAVAARLGLRAVLVLRGPRPPAYDGNLLLERLLGAEVRYCTDGELERLGDVIDEAVAQVRARGGRPYVIPESGANEVGALGYLECAVELAEQGHHGAPRFDAVVISAFTGGSQAGLLLGKQLAGLPGEVVGVPVAAPAEQVRDHVSATMRAAIQRFGLAVEVPGTVHLLDGYQGGAEAADAELDLIARVARQEGLVLDPLCTARGFRGLVETLARDPKALGARVCFIHTGGVFGVYPYRERLSRAIDDRARRED